MLGNSRLSRRDDTHQAVDQLGDADLRRIADEQVDVIALAIELSKLDFEVSADVEVRADVAEDRFQSLKLLVAEHLSSSLGREDQVRV